MQYLDFELEIQPGSGREYPVAVLRSPAGEARSVMQFPFDRLALENHLLKLQNALLRSGGRWRSTLSPEEQAVQAFGASLFEALFTGDVRTQYAISRERVEREGLGLRVKLRIRDPGLAALPWEFLYDSQRAEYLSLSRNSPLVRYLELPQRVLSLTVTPPLRILGMIASPRDQQALDIEREKVRVERAVAGLVQRGLVELTWLAGESWRDLQAAMQGGPWHAFHFIGHGGYDRNRDEGIVVFTAEDGRSEYLGATQLARLLADQQTLRLVLVNACEGARGGETDIFSSTASILVRRGIPAVLAMQYQITDDAAIEIARTFYEALARGLPVDAAVAEARKAVSVAVPNTVEWGTPVLYMRAPDGVLFDIQRVAAAASAPSAADELVLGGPGSRADEALPDNSVRVPREAESGPAAQAEARKQAQESATTSQLSIPGAALRYYAAPLLLDAVLSAGLYAYYRSNRGGALLLLSILIPLLAGIWIGVIVRPAKDLRNYLLAGLCAGLLNSAAVVLVLTLTLPVTLSINWGDVTSLYFLPSFLLVSGGAVVGDRARSRWIGRAPPST